MRTSTTRRGPVTAGLIVILTLALLTAACGDDEAATTQATTTTTPATTTTTMAGMAIPQIDLLAGLLQGLLTSEEVNAALGGDLGLIDQGRRIIPAGSNQRSGFLCLEGQAILDPLGSDYDPQVSVAFSPQGEAGSSTWVTEGMRFEEAAQNAADFAVLEAAFTACTGIAPWETPEAGRVTIESLDLAALGDRSFAARVVMGEGTDVTMETRGVFILAGPALLEVGVNAFLGAPDGIAIGDGGLQNIAEAAFAKIEPGLEEAAGITIAPADPEAINMAAGLLAGLLTTEEIGNGWADLGRMLVPESARGESFGAAFLCPEGLALAESIGSALERTVYTGYRRDGSPGVTLGLVLGHEAELTAAFEAGAAALTACFDRDPWETPDLGTVRMNATDLPALGESSISYYVGPGTPPGADPWLEWETVSILVTNLDPTNDYSVVIDVATMAVHDPAGAAVGLLDHEELLRIAQAVVDRWEYDG